MLIDEIMTRQVITVAPETAVSDARVLTSEHRIRHLPVLDNGRLVGIVTDRDLREALLSEGQRRVGEIMETDVITTHPLDPVGEAARLLSEHRIGCLPVVQEGELVGIVTETDLLRQLVSLLGVDRPGSQIEVTVDDRPGVLAEVAGVIRTHRVNVVSVLTPRHPEPGRRRLVFRLGTIDPRRVIADLESAGYDVRWAAPRLED